MPTWGLDMVKAGGQQTSDDVQQAAGTSHDAFLAGRDDK